MTTLQNRSSCQHKSVFKRKSILTTPTNLKKPSNCHQTTTTQVKVNNKTPKNLTKLRNCQTNCRHQQTWQSCAIAKNIGDTNKLVKAAQLPKTLHKALSSSSTSQSPKVNKRTPTNCDTVAQLPKTSKTPTNLTKLRNCQQTCVEQHTAAQPVLISCTKTQTHELWQSWAIANKLDKHWTFARITDKRKAIAHTHTL